MYLVSQLRQICHKSSIFLAITGNNFALFVKPPICGIVQKIKTTPDTEKKPLWDNGCLFGNGQRCDICTYETKSPRVETKFPRAETKLPRVETKFPRVETKFPRVETKFPRGNFKHYLFSLHSKSTQSKRYNINYQLPT